MAVWRFVNLNLKEAQLLADLTGVQNDIEATEDICDLLLKALEIGRGSVNSENFVTVEALSSAALVRYARSFATGVRSKKIAEAILKSLSPELSEEHRFFLAMRNKHIAHSVNAFEENQVVAYLVPEERGSRDVSTISVQQTRLSCLGSDNVAVLKDICKELRKQIAQLIEKETHRVLTAARKIPMEKLYSQKDPSPHLPEKHEADKRRNFL